MWEFREPSVSGVKSVRIAYEKKPSLRSIFAAARNPELPNLNRLRPRRGVHLSGPVEFPRQPAQPQLRPCLLGLQQHPLQFGRQRRAGDEPPE